MSYLSNNVTYYFDTNKARGFVKTANDEKTITDIRWIAAPAPGDSLVCYSTGDKRGYFNLFTGQPVIRPRYDHAWMFSEGLAAVDEDGWIKFIDTKGNVVINPQLPFSRRRGLRVPQRPLRHAQGKDGPLRTD